MEEKSLPVLVSVFSGPTSFDKYAISKYAVVLPIGFVPIDINQQLVKCKLGMSDAAYWIFTEITPVYKSLPKKIKQFPGVWFTQELLLTGKSVTFGPDTISALTRLGLTAQEINALELMRLVAMAFLSLPSSDPDEHREYNGIFRVLQKSILSRAGLRALNWSEMGKDEDEQDEQDDETMDDDGDLE